MNSSPRINQECTHRVLSNGPGHQISICTCGTVHLNVANTTLRFSRADFCKVAEGILHSLGTLECERPSQSTALH